MENKKVLIGLGILVTVVLISGCIRLQKEAIRLELKDHYEFDEEIKIEVINSMDPAYIYSKDYPYYKIYKLEGETWEELYTFIPYGCACENETLHCPLLIPELPKCTEIRDKKIFQWGQKINLYTFAKCGNKTYNIWEEKIAGPGNYKVEFCFYKSEDIKLYEESCDILENATCIEKEFEITGNNQTVDLNVIEKCGNYKRNGTVYTHCATCGDGICEEFEKCIPSTCEGGICTGDCGPLYCQQDCE